MLTNALAPVRMIELFESLVPESGIIAVMSSEIGSISNCSGRRLLLLAIWRARSMILQDVVRGSQLGSVTRFVIDSRASALMQLGLDQIRTIAEIANAPIRLSVPPPVRRAFRTSKSTLLDFSMPLFDEARRAEGRL